MGKGVRTLIAQSVESQWEKSVKKCEKGGSPPSKKKKCDIIFEHSLITITNNQISPSRPTHRYQYLCMSIIRYPSTNCHQKVSSPLLWPLSFLSCCCCVEFTSSSSRHQFKESANRDILTTFCRSNPNSLENK